MKKTVPPTFCGAIRIDVERARIAAKLLYHAFASTGIFGHTEMPEDLLPSGVSRGSLEHRLFITLTVAIDYQRDAVGLWQSARATFEDPATRYLFDPKALHEVGFAQITKDMQRHGLSRKPQKDARIWTTVGVTFHKKWAGDPCRFLEGCAWDATTVLERLQEDSHPQRSRLVPDYPYLRGKKIGPLWLRMLRDNVRLTELTGLERVPIPVDIHVARATLCLGVVRGRFSGRLDDLFKYVRKAWFEGVKELHVEGRPMIALDVDEPLWHLSKYGCSHAGVAVGCPVRGHFEARTVCFGTAIRISKNTVEMDT